MPKLTDYEAIPEVTDIMESFIERFPKVFEGFDVGQVEVIQTKQRKSKTPITIKAVGFPCYVFMKPYVVEVRHEWWKDMDAKKRNLAVFHIMCHFPEGAFDEQSKNYAKKLRPDIQMFMAEFAASGGIPNWMENPAARNPLEVKEEELVDDEDAVPEDEEGEDGEGEGEEGESPSPDDIVRKPVTQETIENVGLGAEAAV